MNTGLQTRGKAAPIPSFTPVRSGLLQRKCACGGTPGLDGECAECRKKRLSGLPHSTNQAEPTEVPPIVNEVLRSSGQPLDADTRAFMEPRFGHGFGRVRVHADERAAESARAVRALAYTAGQHIIFGARQYAPASRQGRRLLGHELAHVVQQGSSSASPKGIGPPSDHNEREADSAAANVSAGQDATVESTTPAPLLQRQQDFRLTPPTLSLPPRRPLSLFPPGEEPRLRLDLLGLRGVTSIRPVVPTLPPFLTVPPPTGTTTGEEKEEARPIWALEFELEPEEGSSLARILETEERTKQILSNLSGEEAEETPLGLELLNAGVNILAATPPGRAVRERLHLNNVTIVLNPVDGTYGAVVGFEF